MTTLVPIDGSQENPAGAESRRIRFCSRCGEHAAADAARRRVCELCGMGVVLSCSPGALPGTAFLICSYDLIVTAVSRAGERHFGRQTSMVGTRLLDHLTSPLGEEQLARHVALAAQRPAEPVVLPLRPVASGGARRPGTLTARIATCGPPQAALVTVEPSRFGRR